MKNFKKLVFRGAILSLLAFSFVACSDDEDKPDYWTPPLSKTQGAYILNNGNWGSGDASIAYYDKETQTCSAASVFESSNDGLKLGDLGQAMLVTEDKIYIAVSGSAVIYVTDLNCKKIAEIVSLKGSEPQEPRAMATYGNYVYVTYYDGYLARINRKTNELDERQVKVGDNPEGLKIANGKIYVANSGGMNYPTYNNTLSVVDLASFRNLDRDIEVVINPAKMEVDRLGNIYVLSNGNYNYDPNGPDISSSIQRIDTNADTIHSTIGEASYIRMSPAGDKLYFINSVYTSTVWDSKVYDVNLEEIKEGNFVNEDIQFLGGVTSLDIDPATNDIYIGSSLYIFDGEMHVISSTTGELLNKFSTGGLNPWGVYFVK